MSFNERIIIALDVNGEKEAIDLIERLEGKASFVKVGMELFYGTGYSLIEKLKMRNLKIFLDLKLHDIPTTVGRASAQLTRLGVDMFNLHVAGGIKMMESAINFSEAALISGQKKPTIIGVTQLTSTDDTILKNEIGINGTVQETVIKYAALAKEAGLGGVVCSPLEVIQIKKAFGQEYITVTPGIRLEKGNNHDQKRVTTPKEAFNMGSDYIVIGRAITENKEPALAFDSLISSLID